MDTTALRRAYDGLLDTAADPDLRPAGDGGWNADQVLAHVLSVDATVTAAALGVVAGARPVFDNRVCLDPWNLDRIIAGHGGRRALIDAVRLQAGILCDVADRLDDRSAAVLVPAFLMSDGALLVDQPVPLGGLVEGLAQDHVPGHTRQLLGLRLPEPG